MTTEKGWLEQREFQRIKDVLKIVYYPLTGPAADTINSDDYKDTTVEKLQSDKTKHSYIHAMTEDISKGGLSILTSTPLKSGQLIVIDLFLPKISKPVKLLTEVRKIENNIKNSNSYRAGLKIISISKYDIKKIENHIMGLK